MIEERNMFDGMRILQSPYLTESGTPCEVRRTWRERLFTRPWRPLVATRWVTPQIPHRGAVLLDHRTLLMHPITYMQLKTELEPKTRGVVTDKS